MSEPKGLQTFLQQLQALGLPHKYDQTLAEQLRLQASVKSGGIIFVSGRDSIVYAPWVADGMSMTTRLLVHIDSDSNSSIDYQDLKPLFDQDIRIAAHIQNAESFMQDLDKYQFDLMLLHDKNAFEISSTLADKIADRGVVVLLHKPEGDLASMTDHFFVAPAGKKNDALIMSNLSDHRKAGRRGGRSGRNRGR